MIDNQKQELPISLPELNVVDVFCLMLLRRFVRCCLFTTFLFSDGEDAGVHDRIVLKMVESVLVEFSSRDLEERALNRPQDIAEEVASLLVVPADLHVLKDSCPVACVRCILQKRLNVIQVDFEVLVIVLVVNLTDLVVEFLILVHEEANGIPLKVKVLIHDLLIVVGK